MSVYEVPEPEWAQFFDRINGMEEGERINVDVLAAATGRSPERVATSRPLGRMALDGDRRFAVSVINPPEVIELERPVGLRFEQPSEHGRAALIIDAASGDHLVVSFEDPVVPGILDGLP